MAAFVNENSIVRKIWGKADTVLFIFAGSAAEFALNKAVDWLYFTGRLPADPLARLFSTVSYARQIIFSERDEALAAIDRINAIHAGVEQARGATIPDWAYRDVLFMLIDYSIRSFELLERPLIPAEKADVFHVFLQVGQRMKLSGLPQTFEQWQIMRLKHMEEDMLSSDFTVDLYKQYKKHLGLLRFVVVKQVQIMLVPQRVKELLKLNQPAFMRPLLGLYKQIRNTKPGRGLKSALLPATYKVQIQALDITA